MSNLRKQYAFKFCLWCFTQYIKECFLPYSKATQLQQMLYEKNVETIDPESLFHRATWELGCINPGAQQVMMIKVCSSFVLNGYAVV